MNAELKKRWLDALRSGQYVQGRKNLKDKDNRYCCLGILLDVSGLGAWVDPPLNSNDIGLRWRTSTDKLGVASVGYLARPHCKILGIPFSLATKLADMNDAGWPFVATADWLEKYDELYELVEEE